MKRLDPLLDKYKSALILEKNSEERSNEDAINLAIEVCRANSRLSGVKNVLSAKEFNLTKDVTATLLTQSSNEKEEHEHQQVLAMNARNYMQRRGNFNNSRGRNNYQSNGNHNRSNGYYRHNNNNNYSNNNNNSRGKNHSYNNNFRGQSRNNFSNNYSNNRQNGNNNGQIHVSQNNGQQQQQLQQNVTVRNDN